VLLLFRQRMKIRCSPGLLLSTVQYIFIQPKKE
jgi:hypothetical protein